MRIEKYSRIPKTQTNIQLVSLITAIFSVITPSKTLAQAQLPVFQPDGGHVAPIIRAPNSSRGSTGHVTVFGDDIRGNRAVSSIGDDLVRKLARFLKEQEPKESVYPIHLTLYSKGNAKKGVKFSTSVLPIEGKGYRIDIIVDIREGFDKSITEQAIMQALVLERTMRTKPKINRQTIVKVPRWLSDGLVGALHWKDAPSNKAVYNLLTQRPELYPVKELFTTDQKKFEQLGVTKTEIYHASATALVLSLQRQAGGAGSLTKLLSEVSVFEGETEEILRRNFPTMNVGSRGLQKLWNLQLADMSASRMLDTLTIRETEQRLAKSLFFTLRGNAGIAKMIPLKNFDVLVGLVDSERIQVINGLRQKLRQLSYRCYPDYQPLIAEYSFTLTDITKGNFEKVNLRLKNLEEERARLLEAGKRVRNVLDWYLISEAKGLKGDFSGYARVIGQIELEKKRNADPVIAPYVNQINDLMKR